MVNGHPEQHRRRPAETPSITTATRSHQEDLDSRMAKYALAMAIRTACFILIFVLPWPWKWFAAAGAIFLPYVAVLLANAGRERLPVNWGTRGTGGSVPSPHSERAEAPPEQVAAVQVVRGETVEPPAAGPRPTAGPTATPTPGPAPADEHEPPLHRAS